MFGGSGGGKKGEGRKIAGEVKKGADNDSREAKAQSGSVSAAFPDHVRTNNRPTQGSRAEGRVGDTVVLSPESSQANRRTVGD